MSIEAMSGEEPGAVIELFGPEAAIRKHWQLHAEIGRLSLLLSDISAQYNQAIADNIQNHRALKDYGVNTDELARQTLSIINPHSAINNYGEGQD